MIVKIGHLTRRHNEEKTSATTASSMARELRKRLDLSEKSMKERSEKEVYIVKKLEDQLSNAIIEIRRKNNELEDARVSAEVHADAKMRLQSILETQRVEIEQLREYRSISSKLNGEIEENAREKVHLESAMKTLRHEVDKLRHENLQIRTQLSKLNPIQTSLEIELDKARGVENDLKKEIMILRAEVEKETKARHDLTRRGKSISTY